ncbi:uncharacterized protein METZ01_LOCUS249279 [marine metagenome]|uniref:Uncharacterized protein n=1 Tax=marine metagenome TaxID=408172 RepID=A0A382IAQ2_9ZZZZ
MRPILLREGLKASAGDIEVNKLGKIL